MDPEVKPPNAIARLEWPDEDNVIPREIFLDRDLFTIELERVFEGPYWHIVGHVSEVPTVGDFMKASVGRVPILVVRDESERVRVLVNSCAHRSNEVEARPCGNTQMFTCIYHMWKYGLDGTLKSYSMREDYPEDFEMSRYGLQPLKTAVVSGVVFATFSDEAPDLEDYLGPVVLRALRDTFPDEVDLEFVGEQRWRYAGNWKLFAENMYDGYHARVLHRGLRYMGLTGTDGGFLDPENGRPHSVSLSIGSEVPDGLHNGMQDPSVFDVRTKKRSETGEFSNWLASVFPSSVFMSNWDLITIRNIVPTRVDESEVRFAYYVPKGDSDDIRRHRVAKASNLYGPCGIISMEDTVVFERTQRGVAARGSHNILKGTVKQNPPYRKRDEAHMRAFYSAYRQAMSS